MAGAKLVVLYPYPEDVEVFERVYLQEHMPMVNPDALEGMTKFIGTKVLGTADGSPPPFYRIAELHFSSLESLEKAASSEGARKAVAHAVSISTGGTPLFLVAEEQATVF